MLYVSVCSAIHLEAKSCCFGIIHFRVELNYSDNCKNIEIKRTMFSPNTTERVQTAVDELNFAPHTFKPWPCLNAVFVNENYGSLLFLTVLWFWCKYF